MNGALVTKAKPEQKRARGSCKRCRRRRKVEKFTGLCQECTAYHAGASTAPTVKKQEPVQSIEERMGELCLSNLDNRAVEQMQMLGNLIESHYGAVRSPEVEIARKSSYILEVPAMNTSSPLLRAAVSTMCMSYFGAQSGNERLVHASQNAYEHLLMSITKTLRQATSAPSKDHRELITGIMLLSLCDDTRTSRNAPQDAWMDHFWGGLRYLEVYGPGCMDLNHIIDTKLFANLRLSALILSWIKKKALVFDKPEWRISAKTSVFTTDFDDWYMLLAGLGGLLEKAERLSVSSSPLDAPRLASLCAQFSDRRRSLSGWLERDARPARSGIPGIGNVSVTDLDAFDVEIEEHCYITTSHCFVSLYRFANGPRQALRCLTMWVACLVSDCTLLRILHHHPHLEKTVKNPTRLELERNAFTAASDICRAVYGFSKLGSITYAHFLAMALQLARTFFEEHGSLKEMGWCQACLIATNMRIERLKSSQRPTFCRAQTLSDMALADYGRYRSNPSPTLVPATEWMFQPRPQACPISHTRTMDLPRCPIRAS